jgi:hypothetical protein
MLASWLPAALLAAVPPSQVSAQSTTPYSMASLYFELNHTDGDLGIHALIDGDPWHRLAIDHPSGGQMLNIEVKGKLRPQGLTELFYESAEPGFDDLPPKEFFSRFPEGEYKITGTTLDGKTLASRVRLSHVLPAPPVNIKVSGAAVPKNCEDDPAPAVATPAVISWSSVTSSHPDLGKSGPVEVAKYEISVEREGPTPLSLTVDLPATATSFEVPTDFLAVDSGDGFKFTVMVTAANGNRTGAESCFKLKK